MKHFTILFLLVIVQTQALSDTQEKRLHGGVLGSIKAEPRTNGPYEDSEFWNNLCQEDLRKQLLKTPIERMAKNVVFFLGDGASVATLTAGRIYKGLKTGDGERHVMSYEKFPYSSLIKTYNTDNQVTDSAASATAYLTGVKTNQKNIGVDINVLHEDCAAMNNPDFRTTSVLRDFQIANRSTGFVTNTRVTHASPSGNYAHVADRTWENDADIFYDGQDPEVCDDIAEQLIHGESGHGIKVIMGGGRQNFISDNYIDPEGETGGRRIDGKDLIQDWLDDKEMMGVKHEYMWNRDQLITHNPSQTDYLLGLFGYSHMSYVYEQDSAEPSLAEMTQVALQILEKDENGYFLFVEGGHIDHAHHSNKYNSAMLETEAFEEAIQIAVDMTSEQDTLIVVTADHGHPLMINGYPARGNDIGGIAEISDVDGIPYTTLMYGNGPGYKNQDVNGNRPDPTADDITSPIYRGASVAPDNSANHSGEDVVIYARGPFAHLFTGLHENSYIPHALRYASCTGEGLTYCNA